MNSLRADLIARAHPVIGIIGGMGPEATVDLMRRVIAKTPAQDDADHVHLIVESNPKISSRLAHLLDGTGPDPTPELARIAANLERAGADALAMPCNTAHAYAEAIRRTVGIPLLNMVELSADALAARAPGARVGVLASSAVHRVGLYDRALQQRGLEAVVPLEQESVMRLIMDVKRGRTDASARDQLTAVAGGLSKRVDVVLIACTELSAISSHIECAFVDAADVLAESILAFAGITDRAPSGGQSGAA